MGDDRVPTDIVASLSDSLLPGISPVIKHLLRGAFAEWERRGSVALLAAQHVSGLTLDDLTEALQAEPRLHPLLTRLLFAAGMNGHDAVLRGMGAAVGRAASEPALVDECELILTAMADLNATHADLLRLLSTQPDRDTDGGGHWYWTPRTLLAKAAFPGQVGPLVLAALISRGLAEVPPDAWGGPVHITELGKLVLDVLNEWKQAESGGHRGS